MYNIFIFWELIREEIQNCRRHDGFRVTNERRPTCDIMHLIITLICIIIYYLLLILTIQMILIFISLILFVSLLYLSSVYTNLLDILAN